MRQHLGCTVVLLATGVAALSGQGRGYTRTAAHMDVGPGPIVGAIGRTSIPNEYVEVTLTRGTIHVVGIKSDSVAWSVMAQDSEATPQQPRVYVGTTPFADRFLLDVDGVGADKSAHAPDVTLRIPSDLKLLRLTVNGRGTVVVDHFAGELTVTVDSGSVAGAALTGPMSLETREGGIDLSLADSLPPASSIRLLARHGDITVRMPAQPSLVLDFDAACGRINSALHLTMGATVSDSGPYVSTMPAGRIAWCAMSPTFSPVPVEGNYIHNRATVTLGAGATTLHAATLRGDINVMVEPLTSGRCVEIPDLGRNPDGSPVLATLVGRVLGPDGRTPLAAAHVQIVGTPFSAVSGTNGEYRLAFDPRLLQHCRTQYVIVVAPGYVDEMHRLVIGSKVRNDDFVLHGH